MSVGDKMWGAIAAVVRTNDRVERMATTIISQQQKIEPVIRLETTHEIGLTRGWGRQSSRRIESKA